MFVVSHITIALSPTHAATLDSEIQRITEMQGIKGKN